MQIKQERYDFIVKEEVNWDIIHKKEEEADYEYYVLVKHEYDTIKALKKVASFLRIGLKRIHIAGTKDKYGITTQYISLRVYEESFKEKIDQFNSFSKDLQLYYVGKHHGRLNLGDVKENKFIITIRDISDAEKKSLNYYGGLVNSTYFNYFGPQRFGKHYTTHIIGKLLLCNNLQEALRYIIFGGYNEEEYVLYMDMYPELTHETLRIIHEKCHYGKYQHIIEHLLKHPRDYTGALNKIPKHIRKLYIHAYQSYLWNKVVESGYKEKQLSILGYRSTLNEQEKEYYLPLLEKEGVDQEIFALKHLPTLASKGDMRTVYVEVSNISVAYTKNNETTNGIISFTLPKSAYATECINALCGRFKS